MRSHINNDLRNIFGNRGYLYCIFMVFLLKELQQLAENYPAAFFGPKSEAVYALSQFILRNKNSPENSPECPLIRGGLRFFLILFHFIFLYCKAGVG